MGAQRKNVVKRLGILCFIAGILSFFTYPQFFAMNTYMSENALGPTWAVFAYSASKTYINIAQDYANAYHAFQISLPQNLSDGQWSKLTADWISQKLSQLHLNPKTSSFSVPPSTSTDKHHLTAGNVQEDQHLVEVMLEGPRSSGAEAVILTGRFERLSSTSPKPVEGATYSWSFLASFLHMVQHQHWRSKDIVLVLTPATAGTRGAEFWIDRLNVDSSNGGDALQFRHSFIIASLTIELPLAPKLGVLSVRPEGFLGTLPNLDLANTIFRVAYRRDFKWLSWTPHTKYSQLATPLLELLLQVPILKPYLTSDNFNAWSTLFSTMLNMAYGAPTGDHSLISKYKIEAVTIALEPAAHGATNLKKFGETLEGTLRSLNNLIEPLHQSFYYYLPLTPFTFVPIGHYMITFGMLYVPVALWVLMVLIPASTDSLLDAGARFTPFALVGLFSFLLPSWLPSILPQLLENAGIHDFKAMLSSILDFMPQLGPITTDEEQYAFLQLVLVLLASVIALAFVLSRKRRVPATEDNLDVLGALSMTPYLIFLAAAGLVNASFAFVAIIPTLPILAFSLLSRRVPHLLRLPLALAAHPINLLLLYNYFIQPSTSIPHILADITSNWLLYRGLTFPFACFYLSLSLQSLDLSLQSSVDVAPIPQ